MTFVCRHANIQTIKITRSDASKTNICLFDLDTRYVFILFEIYLYSDMLRCHANIGLLLQVSSFFIIVEYKLYTLQSLSSRLTAKECRIFFKDIIFINLLTIYGKR